ncbi:hypothetical protein SCHPADRAFT_811808, partial [Schizopora paradoxa]
PSEIRIITWNIDYMAKDADRRLLCILDHLQNYLSQEPSDSNSTSLPSIVLLQEVHTAALPALLSHPWVRATFNLTPTSRSDWHPYSSYGNVALIHKSIPVTRVFKIVFEESMMGRFALLVDVELGEEPHDESTVHFRIANVHLESLALGAHARPRQLRAVALALKEDSPDNTEQPFLGGLVCGDMNSIQASDKNTPAEVGLLDAFQGEEGAESESSYTWGYQPPSRRFPPARLDKILYTPPDELSSSSRAYFEVESPTRVGVGLRAPASGDSEGGEEEEGVWASDHYGLATTL